MGVHETSKIALQGVLSITAARVVSERARSAEPRASRYESVHLVPITAHGLLLIVESTRI